MAQRGGRDGLHVRAPRIPGRRDCGARGRERVRVRGRDHVPRPRLRREMQADPGGVVHTYPGGGRMNHNVMILRLKGSTIDSTVHGQVYGYTYHEPLEPGDQVEVMFGGARYEGEITNQPKRYEVERDNK